MTTRLITTAIFAGFLTGVFAAFLQFLFVQPVLLHAELYESGALSHFGSAEVESASHGLSFDPLRDGLSILFSAVIYTGYALILVALMALRDDAAISARSGMIWGIAGFIAVQLAPAFGLPPELPGSAAADVGTRQIWWFATVACTGGALWLIAFGSSSAITAIGVVLLALPHIIGAPHPAAFTGPVPPELAAQFAARSLGVGCGAWALLGLLSAYFWQPEDAT